ncbi:MAG: DUF3999 family protein [bacterium]
MRRTFAAAIGVLLLVAPARAGFEARDWLYRKPIRLETAAAAAYAEAGLDKEVYANAARSLADLRIVGGDGAEVPYVLRWWDATRTEAAVPAAILNRSVLPQRSTRLELDAGRPGRPHNQIRLTIGEREFWRRVTVEGSDDRRTWLVLTTTPIFRFTEAASVEQTTLFYPRSLYRYLRITIRDDGQPPLTVEEAELLFERVVPAREDRWVDDAVTPMVDAAAKTTTVTLDLGGSGLPVSRVVLTVTAPASFARTVEIAASGDAQSWSGAGSATIFRGPRTSQTPIGITFPEVQTRSLRLTVRNGDNAPLTISRVAAYGIRRTLLFPTATAHPYYLYLGGAAPPPTYDLAEILSREPAPPRPAAASLGALEANPSYVAPLPPRRPWTEEHPALFWSILAAVVVVLGLVILRTVRSTGAGPTP